MEVKISQIRFEDKYNELVFKTMDVAIFLLGSDRTYTHLGFKQRVDKAKMSQSMFR
ncbi:hypothetical protein [Sutcliffiella rhizosphaerae]|uniref:Uncharacterized protein n=1 Tax=Sutcliffiella rhizosphaerae TaxID=2880967 RepID=A0ABN8ADT5_9BACI|nr:hypothetical protein [Sutcliffiella rhizosphaerae]CAG9623394.1 hypothetical protein BACCIP111883_04205 [Sutcliffiella rhizosphaerae]